MQDPEGNQAPNRPSGPPAPPSPVWTRSPAIRRAPLTREAIVATAVSLADAEGLEAVSIRRIAAALKARPMSIYSFAAIKRKEELLDLMIDGVCAEMLLPGELPGRWRDALRNLAVRFRDVLIRHPWWIELIGRHVLIGPNVMRYREQTLAAVAGLQIDASLKMALVMAVETYTVGQAALAIETGGPAGKQSRSHHQRLLANESFRQILIATGEFPHLAAIGPAFQEAAADHQQIFLLGLDWLLCGISADLEERRRASGAGGHQIAPDPASR